MLLQIIIPAYNCSKTLARALDSLATQVNKNFNVILVDDCSSEDLLSILNQYKNKLDIKYIRNDKNIGCGMSRQRGIDEADAEYIAFLDADDILLPNAVDLWLHEIKNKPEVIYTPYIPKTGRFWLTLNTSFPLYMCHGKCYNREFLIKNNIREIPEIYYNDDVYFNFLVFTLAEKIAISYEITHIYMITAGSITQDKNYSANARAEEACMYDHIFKHLQATANITTLDRYNQLSKSITKVLRELARTNPEKYLQEKLIIL